MNTLIKGQVGSLTAARTTVMQRSCPVSSLSLKSKCNAAQRVETMDLVERTVGIGLGRYGGSGIQSSLCMR